MPAPLASPGTGYAEGVQFAAGGHEKARCCRGLARCPRDFRIRALAAHAGDDFAFFHSDHIRCSAVVACVQFRTPGGICERNHPAAAGKPDQAKIHSAFLRNTDLPLRGRRPAGLPPGGAGFHGPRRRCAGTATAPRPATAAPGERSFRHRDLRSWDRIVVEMNGASLPCQKRLTKGPFVQTTRPPRKEIKRMAPQIAPRINAPKINSTGSKASSPVN